MKTTRYGIGVGGGYSSRQKHTHTYKSILTLYGVLKSTYIDDDTRIIMYKSKILRVKSYHSTIIELRFINRYYQKTYFK